MPANLRKKKNEKGTVFPPIITPSVFLISKLYDTALPGGRHFR